MNFLTLIKDRLKQKNDSGHLNNVCASFQLKLTLNGYKLEIAIYYYKINQSMT